MASANVPVPIPCYRTEFVRMRAHLFISEPDLPGLPRSSSERRSDSSPSGNFTVCSFRQTFVFITSSVTARDLAGRRSTPPAYRGSNAITSRKQRDESARTGARAYRLGIDLRVRKINGEHARMVRLFFHKMDRARVACIIFRDFA